MTNLQRISDFFNVIFARGHWDRVAEPRGEEERRDAGRSDPDGRVRRNSSADVLGSCRGRGGRYGVL